MMKQSSNGANNIGTAAESEQPHLIPLAFEHATALVDILDLLQIALAENGSLYPVCGDNIVGGANARDILRDLVELLAGNTVPAMALLDSSIDAVDVCLAAAGFRC